MKFILLIKQSIVIIFFGCGNECNSGVVHYRSKEISLVVNKVVKFPQRSLDIQGINTKTGKQEKYFDRGGWYTFYNQQIEVGDTVVKKLNELSVFIHKKDTVLRFTYSCGGREYR